MWEIKQKARGRMQESRKVGGEVRRGKNKTADGIWKVGIEM